LYLGMSPGVAIFRLGRFWESRLNRRSKRPITQTLRPQATKRCTENGRSTQKPSKTYLPFRDVPSSPTSLLNAFISDFSASYSSILRARNRFVMAAFSAMPFGVRT